MRRSVTGWRMRAMQAVWAFLLSVVVGVLPPVVPVAARFPCPCRAGRPVPCAPGRRCARRARRAARGGRIGGDHGRFRADAQWRCPPVRTGRKA